MIWRANLNDEEPNCLIIKFVSFKCVVNQCCLLTSFLKHVLRLELSLVMAHVKLSCGNHAETLVDELQGGFLDHELMSTLGLIYLNFWAQNFDNVGDDFHQCLIIINATYYSFRKVGKDGVWVKALLDGQLLDTQCFF